MNVIGIIAEYNPFHNGHAYQIAHVKKNLHADYIVVAASGDYVQRGEPALLDKYTVPAWHSPRAQISYSSSPYSGPPLPRSFSRTPESPSLRKRAA